MNKSVDDSIEIRVVSSPKELLTKQNIPYFVGLSYDTVGAKNLAMHLIVIPPGASSEAHYHQKYETGIYVLEGRVETKYGEHLEKSVINGPGDFIYIPPNVIHQATNLDQNKSAKAIVVRNDANEQENVIPVEIKRA